MFINLNSGFFYGIDVHNIEIQVDVQTKVKGFEIVGLPDAMVKESVQRIQSAITNSGFHFPGRRIVVNLAPAGLKKIGTLFDLPIALGILANDFDFIDLGEWLLIGELSLDGKIKKIRGGLPLALKAKDFGYNKILCPFDNAKEMALAEGVNIYPVKTLAEAVEILTQGVANKSPYQNQNQTEVKNSNFNDLDMKDVKGQQASKRAIEVAAAGNHNAILVGPPGTGKTMLIKRLPGILPPMNRAEAIETTMIYSVSGLLNTDAPLMYERPFRSPHHTASDVSIVGGGRFPHPGEISLAHNGILFLDEFQLYKSNVLQVLRQPLEEKSITITRVEGSITFPARFMLIAALNPSKKNIELQQCDTTELQNLIRKISSPIIDRIDIHIQISRSPFEEIISHEPQESSEKIRQRIIEARQTQENRLREFGILTNSDMSHKLIEKFCVVKPNAQSLLKLAMEKFMLSIRSYDKILKIARTIADLDHKDKIEDYHISEAIQYRFLDRFVNLI